MGTNLTQITSLLNVHCETEKNHREGHEKMCPVKQNNESYREKYLWFSHLIVMVWTSLVRKKYWKLRYEKRYRARQDTGLLLTQRQNRYLVGEGGEIVSKKIREETKTAQKIYFFMRSVNIRMQKQGNLASWLTRDPFLEIGHRCISGD